MFVVLLKFSDNRDRAGHFMAAHRAWIQQGFDEGIFLLVGSLEPDLGGAVVAHQISRTDLQRRVNDDPFIVEKIVTAEILEISPSRASAALEFLVGH